MRCEPWARAAASRCQGRALLGALGSRARQGEFQYAGEGWGLCHDGRQLVMSDGSDVLTRRDARTFGIAKRVYIAVDDDAERARRRLVETLQRFYPFFQSSHLEAFPVYGPPDACARGLREVAEIGAELILLNPAFDEAEQMERLAAEVIPKLS